jgi:hypothetical protein
LCLVGVVLFVTQLKAQALWAQAGIASAAGAQSVSNLPADTPPRSPASILKDSTSGSSSAATTGPAITTAANVPPTTPAARSAVQNVEDDVKEAARRLAHLTKAQRRKWEMAQASLPSFCREWDRMLHDREVNNLSHLVWHEREGYETASYTGYGAVQGCQAKESDEGVPIGKVTYDERDYYLAGKTTDEAKQHPKLVGITRTLEIFSYEKDRWFY